ncbi:MAG: hypothetical protein GXO26_01735 [Crenarchaeota archaeon]|nr:hypothetical protein [Thermoproteota archaeon]
MNLRKTITIILTATILAIAVVTYAGTFIAESGSLVLFHVRDVLQFINNSYSDSGFGTVWYYNITFPITLIYVGRVVSGLYASYYHSYGAFTFILEGDRFILWFYGTSNRPREPINSFFVRLADDMGHGCNAYVSSSVLKEFNWIIGVFNGNGGNFTLTDIKVGGYGGYSFRIVPLYFGTGIAPIHGKYIINITVTGISAPSEDSAFGIGFYQAGGLNAYGFEIKFGVGTTGNITHVTLWKRYDWKPYLLQAFTLSNPVPIIGKTVNILLILDRYGRDNLTIIVKINGREVVSTTINLTYYDVPASYWGWGELISWGSGSEWLFNKVIWRTYLSGMYAGIINASTCRIYINGTDEASEFDPVWTSFIWEPVRAWINQFGTQFAVSNTWIRTSLAIVYGNNYLTDTEVKEAVNQHILPSTGLKIIFDPSYLKNQTYFYNLANLSNNIKSFISTKYYKIIPTTYPFAYVVSGVEPSQKDAVLAVPFDTCVHVSGVVNGSFCDFGSPDVPYSTALVPPGTYSWSAFLVCANGTTTGCLFSFVEGNVSITVAVYGLYLQRLYGSYSLNNITGLAVFGSFYSDNVFLLNGTVVFLPILAKLLNISRIELTRLRKVVYLSISVPQLYQEYLKPPIYVAVYEYINNTPTLGQMAIATGLYTGQLQAQVDIPYYFYDTYGCVALFSPATGYLVKWCGVYLSDQIVLSLPSGSMGGEITITTIGGEKLKLPQPVIPPDVMHVPPIFQTLAKDTVTGIIAIGGILAVIAWAMRRDTDPFLAGALAAGIVGILGIIFKNFTLLTVGFGVFAALLVFRIMRTRLGMPY